MATDMFRFSNLVQFIMAYYRMISGGAGTAYRTDYSCGPCRSISICLCSVLWTFVLWPLSFDLLILITTLVSSTFLTGQPSKARRDNQHTRYDFNSNTECFSMILCNIYHQELSALCQRNNNVYGFGIFCVLIAYGCINNIDSSCIDFILLLL